MAINDNEFQKNVRFIHYFFNRLTALIYIYMSNITRVREQDRLYISIAVIRPESRVILCLYNNWTERV